MIKLLKNIKKNICVTLIQMIEVKILMHLLFIFKLNLVVHQIMEQIIYKITMQLLDNNLDKFLKYKLLIFHYQLLILLK